MKQNPKALLLSQIMSTTENERNSWIDQQKQADRIREIISRMSEDEIIDELKKLGK